MSMIRKSLAQTLTVENAVTANIECKRSVASKLVPDQGHRRDPETRLVGAGALDVARLLAAVANTLGRGLLGAVAGKMTDLAAWLHVRRIHQAGWFVDIQL